MPYIEKLVMRGFKSFAIETDIPLTNSMNVVVGPNGSGKSNVADAICFVLGRLSIKSIRAAKASNLIFAGTKDKKPMNEASVKIVFNNSDKGFSINSDKVEIERLVRKNGQGIYRINNETKTRNEIIELLAHAGIDPHGFNIVMQGEIMDLVKMNPEERRGVIEEVAGISVYEVRKKRSLHELEKTDERLKEINAILRERGIYLRNLENERQQALRFKKLEENLKKYKITLLQKQINEKREELEKIQKETDKNTSLKEKVKEKILHAQQEVQKMETEINEINAYTQKTSGVEMEALHNDVSNLRAELAGLDVRKENLASRIEEVLRRRERAKEDIKNYEKEISELKKKSPLVEKKQKELEIRKKELEGIEEKRRKFYSIKSELDSLRTRISDKRNQLQKIRNESDFSLNEIKKLSELLVNKSTEACKQRIGELHKLISESAELIKTKEADILAFEKQLSLSGGDIEKNKKIKEQVSKLDICPLCKSKITSEHIEEVYNECDEGIKSAEKTIDKAKSGLEDAKHEIGKLKSELEAKKSELNKNNIELVRLDSVEERKNHIKRLVSQEQEAEKEIISLEDQRKKIEALFKDTGDVEQVYDKLLMEIEDISSRTEGNIDAEIKFKQRDLDQTKNIIKQTARDEEDLKRELDDVEEQISGGTSRLRSKEKQEDELQKKFQKLFEKRNLLQSVLQEKNAYLINLNHEQRGFEDVINNIKVEKARISAEEENLLIETKGFEGVEVLSGSISIAVLREKIEKTQYDLAGVGSVNLRALEMYDEVKKEYDSVAERAENLTKEKEEILKIIAEIDKKKRRSLMKTLDALNEIFSRNFMQLSTKGQAFLDLENKEDPFAGGLNIIIRVARGKYFDVSSLSGGEKTLIALSLIFAIQEYKPYSFYVFDEVDAALDKRNSEKLASLIKKHMKSGQYIVITHNDALITESTILYGVSMQDGISKIVSLRV